MTARGKIATLLLCAFISAGFMILLYISSEKQRHDANPFIRRYTTGAAEMANNIDLKNTTMYFIGTEGSKIYMGDMQAPLHLFVFDTLLKTKKHFKINLESDQFPFTRVQIKIRPPYFYVADGSVPVIFKGRISDWRAKLLMSGNKQFFTHAEIISEDEIAIRSFQADGRGTVIGKFTFRDSLQVSYAPWLLQKQIDGYFDVDGILKYDQDIQKFIYLYYYRNEFIVADNKLELQYRGKTIDTNHIADLKISYNKETGERQLASSSIAVNRLMSSSGNLMFVNSNVPGCYEDEEMWKQASVVDVYDLNKRRYVSSFYIHSFDEKISDMLVVKSNIYVIIGHHLHRYKLNKELSGR